MENNSEEKLLSSEGGMFILELPRLIEEANLLIEASVVDDKCKTGCKEVITKLSERAENEKDETGVYDIGRSAISTLYSFLDERDPEQKSLFEALRGVISKTVYSVKGWKYPPEPITPKYS